MVALAGGGGRLVIPVFMKGIDSFETGLGRKNEFVGCIVTICSWRCRGRDHSGARTTSELSSSWMNIKYSVSSRTSIWLTGNLTLIQSRAGEYLSCEASTPCSANHS